MKTKKIQKAMKRMDNFKQSKWMMYEREIIRYYYPQLAEWLKTGMKKPSVLAFTSGLGRDIARLMEDSKEQGKEEVEKLIDKLKYIIAEHDLEKLKENQ
jgi:hypothetical protein